MLGSLILYLKGMRRMMFQLSGFYCRCRGRLAETGRDFGHRCCRLGSEAVQSLARCGERSIHASGTPNSLCVGGQNGLGTHVSAFLKPCVPMTPDLLGMQAPAFRPLSGIPGGVHLGSGDFACGFVPQFWFRFDSCVHTYIHTYTHTHTYIHKYIHTYIHTYRHTYIHTCVHIIYSYRHIIIHIYIYVYTYTCIYT